LAGELKDPREVADKLTVSWRESKETRNKAVTKVVKQKALKPVDHPAKPSTSPKQSVVQASPKVWYWPTKQGKVIQRYHAHEPGKRGLQLSGLTGQAIFSAADGRVVYSGSGLTRYGKLIIIKHNATFLSAYAHNRRLLVKEGERIRAGQKIAEMGSTGTNRIKLHFEIRRNGKPVDPLRYLPKQMP